MNNLYKPSSDFASVRDGRNSPEFYFDVDLTNARSIAAGTALIQNVSGNSFYIDANPSDGNAVVKFQDTSLDRVSTPFYVSPGFIANLPFTQLLIENAAQPGKKIRIVYGVDVDFAPGSVSQISVSNAGGYTAARPEVPTGFWNDISVLAANTPITVFTPAANINGAIILSAYFTEVISVAGYVTFVSKSSAPASPIDGSVYLQGLSYGGPTGTLAGVLPKEQYVPAGQGLYYIASAALGASAYNVRSARYKLL